MKIYYWDLKDCLNPNKLEIIANSPDEARYILENTIKTIIDICDKNQDLIHFKYFKNDQYYSCTNAHCIFNFRDSYIDDKLIEILLENKVLDDFYGPFCLSFTTMCYHTCICNDIIKYITLNEPIEIPLCKVRYISSKND